MKPTIPAAALSMLLAMPAEAHFGMILPDPPMLDREDGREIALRIGFGHPFAPSGMPLDTPLAFGVRTPQGAKDLLAALQAAISTALPATS